MSECRFGVSPVNYLDPDPDPDQGGVGTKHFVKLPNTTLKNL